jgi:hypothetical protein
LSSLAYDASTRGLPIRDIRVVKEIRLVAEHFLCAVQ